MSNLLRTIILSIIVVFLAKSDIVHDHHGDGNATEKEILLRMEKMMKEHTKVAKKNQKILINELVSINRNMSTLFEALGLKNQASETQ